MIHEHAVPRIGGRLIPRCLLAVGFLLAAARCQAAEPDFGLVVTPPGQRAPANENTPADKKAVDALRRYLTAAYREAEVVTYDSLEQAASSEANVLVLVMSRRRGDVPGELVTRLKEKKVIGVGYGAAQLFGQLELEINGGACAHFGQMPNLLPTESVLLGTKWDSRDVTAYREPATGDHFGMYIPKLSDKTYAVDVIARAKRDENYAPIVCQGNDILMGVSTDPTLWSDDLADLFGDIAKTLRDRELKPFTKPAYPLLAPGQHAFRLGKGRSTDELFAKTFYFKFDRPTLFTATLQHVDSQSMMMLFVGQNERLHWTREDAKNGEPLRIECDITQRDLERIGDNYWTLKVTNFDRGNPSACVLNVEYDLGL